MKRSQEIGEEPLARATKASPKDILKISLWQSLWLLIFSGLMFLCGVVDSLSNLGDNLGKLVEDALSF